MVNQRGEKWSKLISRIMIITEQLARNYRLSKNFTLYEFLHSDTAIAGNYMNLQYDITEKHILNLMRLCTFVLQPIRDHIKTPITIPSGYRSLRLNSEIKGSLTSDHMQAKAADWVCTDMKKAWEFAKKLPFKQLIKYGDFRFIHVAYDEFDNRKQTLTFS